VLWNEKLGKTRGGTEKGERDLIVLKVPEGEKKRDIFRNF